MYTLISVSSDYFNNIFPVPVLAAAARETFYGIQGFEKTLMAYTNITGNPAPHSSTWEKNSASLPGDGRFNTTITGQLTITDLVVGDTGNYTNTLTNSVSGIDRSIRHSVELQVFGE